MAGLASRTISSADAVNSMAMFVIGDDATWLARRPQDIPADELVLEWAEGTFASYREQSARVLSEDVPRDPDAITVVETSDQVVDEASDQVPDAWYARTAPRSYMKSGDRVGSRRGKTARREIEASLKSEAVGRYRP